MKVVLNKKVQNLGYKDDIVNVKPGYFRNFLFVRGLADMANAARIKIAGRRKEKMVMEKQQILENAADLLLKLKGLNLSIKAKASEKGKLFGSINEEDIIEAIFVKKNIRLEKEFVKMDSIKEIGKYDVEIDFGEKHSTKVKVKVEKA